MGGQKGKKQGASRVTTATKDSSKKELKGAQKLEIRHILCNKCSEKDASLAEIRGGKPFSEVAERVSEDKARAKGYLGWKTVKDVERPFWDAALQCEPSSDKSPSIVEFTSKEKGRDPRYHLIMVHNRK